MAETSITPDAENNQLTIVLEGFFNDEQALYISEQVKKGIDEMQEGFDVINDIRNFKPTTPKGTEYLEATQLYAIENGMKRIVRIVKEDDYDIGKLQFERKGRNVGVKAMYARSMDEAMKLLQKE